MLGFCSAAEQGQVQAIKRPPRSDGGRCWNYERAPRCRRVFRRVRNRGGRRLRWLCQDSDGAAHRRRRSCGCFGACGNSRHPVENGGFAKLVRMSGFRLCPPLLPLLLSFLYGNHRLMWRVTVMGYRVKDREWLLHGSTSFLLLFFF